MAALGEGHLADRLGPGLGEDGLVVIDGGGSISRAIELVVRVNHHRVLRLFVVAFLESDVVRVCSTVPHPTIQSQNKTKNKKPSLISRLIRVKIKNLIQ
jgi:hypothetical protein